ncbi:hypothetical protein J7T55_005359 [Diaporthe amygdali]|uniref:uncharacterized protein n=1 Tax=Phomopsis amygdali TaxID=1214568 RepID=UPI0022FE84AD|nr:uncharacterized protein J7T55_005359 [Diaporthe amygdali]KAJ0108382.1 hypothetical protein J7T55_005359 [Diaporthe amygdali]
MTRLWTPQLRREFHKAVETLYETSNNPSEEINYRNSLRDAPPSRHTLQLRDELQLADHVAYLAHTQEGAYTISAACVEENENGLIIRLASNRTQGDELQDLLFEDVVGLSKERILQRVRPPWMPTPPYFRGAEKPLWERIDQILKSFGYSTTYGDVISRLEAFVSKARALKNKPDEAQLRVAISSIVRSCAEVSYSGDYKSLEEQLKTIPHNLVTKDYMQIDKLARYFGLCRDLGKLAQRLSFRGTTKAITLERLIAFEAEKPAGALKPCYVHAETALDSQTEEVAATGFATMHPAATVSCLNLPAALDLQKRDLPHHQKLDSKAETCLDLDRLIVMFDCSSISTGSLSIQQIETNKPSNNENGVKNIRVNEIPDTEMCIGSVRSSKLKFRLQTQGNEALEIEIVSN